MRTIYLVSQAKITGPINQGLNILSGMKKNGRVNSFFVTMNPENPKSSWLQRYFDAKIEVVQFNLSRWNIISTIFKLRKLVSDQSIDVIHACGFRAVMISLFAHTKAKIVITQRCNPNEVAEKYSKYIQNLATKIYLFLIKKVDSIVACSKSIQSILKEEYHIDAQCVQNGVNTDFFCPVLESEKYRLREELTLPIKKRMFLVLGSLRDRKNNKLIVEAFNNLLDDDYFVVFVGTGPESDLLKELSKKNDRLIFAGGTKFPVKYLQASDILISASLAEGLPNTVLEALSCGLPCILSDINPHKELIENTNAGVIFDRNSCQSLITAINDSYQWNMEEKSKAARSVAEDNFGICSLANKYELIYKSLFLQS